MQRAQPEPQMIRWLDAVLMSSLPPVAVLLTSVAEICNQLSAQPSALSHTYLVVGCLNGELGLDVGVGRHDAVAPRRRRPPL